MSANPAVVLGVASDQVKPMRASFLQVLYDDGTREAVNMYQKRWELLDKSNAEESDAECEDQPSPGGDDTSAQVEVPQIELPQYLPMPPSMRGHCTSERWV